MSSFRKDLAQIKREGAPMNERLHGRPELAHPIDENFLRIKSDEPVLDLPDKLTIEKKWGRDGHQEISMIDIPDFIRKTVLADEETSPEAMLERTLEWERAEREDAEVLGLSELVDADDDVSLIDNDHNGEKNMAAAIVLVPSTSGASTIFHALHDHIPERIIVADDLVQEPAPLTRMELDLIHPFIIEPVVANVAAKRSHNDDSGKRTEKFWNKIKGQTMVRMARKVLRRR